MKKTKKSMDWYGLSQRFSIRKYHFGAVSVLLGAALITVALDGTPAYATSSLPLVNNEAQTLSKEDEKEDAVAQDVPVIDNDKGQNTLNQGGGTPEDETLLQKNTAYAKLDSAMAVRVVAIKASGANLSDIQSALSEVEFATSSAKAAVAAATSLAEISVQTSAGLDVISTVVLPKATTGSSEEENLMSEELNNEATADSQGEDSGYKSDNALAEPERLPSVYLQQAAQEVASEENEPLRAGFDAAFSQAPDKQVFISTQLMDNYSESDSEEIMAIFESYGIDVTTSPSRKVLEAILAAGFELADKKRRLDGGQVFATRAVGFRIDGFEDGNQATNISNTGYAYYTDEKRYNQWDIEAFYDSSTTKFTWSKKPGGTYNLADEILRVKAEVDFDKNQIKWQLVVKGSNGGDFVSPLRDFNRFENLFTISRGLGKPKEISVRHESGPTSGYSSEFDGLITSSSRISRKSKDADKPGEGVNHNGVNIIGDKQLTAFAGGDKYDRAYRLGATGDGEDSSGYNIEKYMYYSKYGFSDWMSGKRNDEQSRVYSFVTDINWEEMRRAGHLPNVKSEFMRWTGRGNERTDVAIDNKVWVVLGASAYASNGGSRFHKPNGGGYYNFSKIGEVSLKVSAKTVRVIQNEDITNSAADFIDQSKMSATLPANRFEWAPGGKPDTSSPGQKQGKVRVYYGAKNTPHQYFEEIAITADVVPLATARKVTVIQNSDQNALKEEIKNAVTVPEGWTIGIVSGEPPTNTPTVKDVNVSVPLTNTDTGATLKGILSKRSSVSGVTYSKSGHNITITSSVDVPVQVTPLVSNAQAHPATGKIVRFVVGEDIDNHAADFVDVTAIPEGKKPTDFKWGKKPARTVDGDKSGTVIVSYPDNSTQTVSVTADVVPLVSASRVTVAQDSNQNTLKENIKNAVTVPEGWTVGEVTGEPSTATPTNRDENVSVLVTNTVTEPTKGILSKRDSSIPGVTYQKTGNSITISSSVNVPVEVTAKPQSKDADAHPATGKTVRFLEGDNIDNNAADFVDVSQIPTDKQPTNVIWKEKPATTLSGGSQKQGVVTVTYPDKSTKDVTVTADVVGKSFSANTVTVVQDSPKSELTPKVQDAVRIQNEWQKGEVINTPETNTVGTTHKGTVTVKNVNANSADKGFLSQSDLPGVTYSKEENKVVITTSVEVPVTVTPRPKTNAETYDVTGKTIRLLVGEDIDNHAAEFVDVTTIPEGKKPNGFKWTDKPGTRLNSKKTGVVTVTYPDGSTENVTVNVDVVGHTYQKGSVTVIQNTPVETVVSEIQKAVPQNGEWSPGDVTKDPDVTTPKAGADNKAQLELKNVNANSKNKDILRTSKWPELVTYSKDKEGNVVVSLKVDAPVTVTAKPLTDAETYNPTGKTIRLLVDEDIDDNADEFVDVSQIPTDKQPTNVIWKEKPATTLSGGSQKQGVVTVTYPDQSTEDVTINVDIVQKITDSPTVSVVEGSPQEALVTKIKEGVQVSGDWIKGEVIGIPDTNTPITGAKARFTLNNVNSSSVKDILKKPSSLPGVTYSETNDTVIISQTIDATVNVSPLPHADKYDVTGRTIRVITGEDIEDNIAEFVDTSKIVLKDRPTNFAWVAKPDTTTSDRKNGSVRVTYKDNSTEEVSVIADIIPLPSETEVVEVPLGLDGTVLQELIRGGVKLDNFWTRGRVTKEPSTSTPGDVEASVNTVNKTPNDKSVGILKGNSSVEGITYRVAKNGAIEIVKTVPVTVRVLPHQENLIVTVDDKQEVPEKQQVPQNIKVVVPNKPNTTITSTPTAGLSVDPTGQLVGTPTTPFTGDEEEKEVQIPVKVTVTTPNGEEIKDVVVPVTVLRDTDGDGIPDKTDTDDDNDGIPDTEDAQSKVPNGLGVTVDNSQTVPDKKAVTSVKVVTPSKPNSVITSIPTNGLEIDKDGNLVGIPTDVPYNSDEETAKVKIPVTVENPADAKTPFTTTVTVTVLRDTDGDGIPDTEDAQSKVPNGLGVTTSNPYQPVVNYAPVDTLSIKQKAKETATLPSTGETNSSLLAAYGALGLMAGLGLVARKKRRDDEA
ncbi:Rib/alpha-like domain-containing protein [Streptococcus pluranimalium]